MTRPEVETSYLRAQALYDLLGVKMGQMQAATRVGNLSSMGNAAHDAEAAAMGLALGLSVAFDAAATLDAQIYDARLTVAAPFKADPHAPIPSWDDGCHA